MISEERKQEILATVTPEIQSQELVQDGTGNNYRPLILTYEAEDFIVTETRSYANPANSSGWKAYTKSLTLQEVTNG